MVEVDFYRLERPVQDRFADSTRGIGVPVPLVRVAPVERQAAYWAGAAAFPLLVLAVLVSVGFGRLDHPWALAPGWMLGVYVALAVVAVFCALRAWAIRFRQATRPYRAGLYLFPVGVVDARREPFRVYRLPEIESVDASESTLRVQVASGETFSFPMEGSGAAMEAQRGIEESRELYDKARARHDRRELAKLDPVIDSGFSSPFSPKLPLVKKVPLWDRLAPILALVVGATTAVGVWKMRNVLSERRLFETAKAEDTVRGYRAYVARGGPRREVTDVLLPRAELGVAAGEGTVEAIERFADAHPNAKIEGEIRAALQAALDAELKEVEKKHSVLALRDLAERRSAYPYIQEPIERSIERLYEGALGRFRQAANPDHPDVVAFAAKLLDYAAAHGPRVDLRWVRRQTSSLEVADAQVKRSAYYMGKRSIPSQYFGPESAARRESEVGPAIVAELQDPFPKEILDFQIGPPVALSADAPLPRPERPTLWIEHSPNLAGGYMSTRPRGVFVGVGMMFLATFAIPGGSDPVVVKASTWRVPDARVLKEDGKTVADVYDDMVVPGYERFQKEFLDYWFSDSRS